MEGPYEHDTPTDTAWRLAWKDTRNGARRPLRMRCEIVSHDWDVPVVHRVAELSPSGAWIDTLLPLQPGAEVVLCFASPVGAEELMFFAEVRRVVTGRRRGDRAPLGMALSFRSLAGVERDQLAGALGPAA
jgi:hypothetical protein